jgi:uncharacterized protein
MKFIIDQMMGKLCKWLRILGYDAEYYEGKDFNAIRERCIEENRIFITKSVKNYKKAKLENALLINVENPGKQLKILIQHLGLDFTHDFNFKLFSRCLECNTPVIKAKKENLKDRVPEKSYFFNDEFNECPKCKKIYWKGTHFTKTIIILEKIMQKD